MKKAAKGQRSDSHRKSFRNKYLALLILLLSFGFARGQQVTYTPMAQAGYVFKYQKSDSGNAMPFRNLSLGRGTTRPGPVIINIADTGYYYYNGLDFIRLDGKVDSVTSSGNNVCQWKRGIPKCYLLNTGGSTFFGIDSLTYVGNSICWWKSGTPTCYSLIPGIDSVVVTGNQLCQWKNGVATCFTINGNVLGTGIDSVTVIGTQLCQWTAGVSTCYTINNTNVGIDSVTVVDTTMCTWSGGVSTCFPFMRRTIIYVKDDLTVDSTTNTGFQTLGRLHNDGLESGGIITSAGCLSINVTSPSYYLVNGRHYIAPAITLTVPTPDPSLPRTDRIVADTFGVVYIIPGTPSVAATPPSFNPASQISIATYPVGAGATCLSITSIIIYDETGGTEYTPSTHGTITANPVNTDNPEHLLKDYFISSYGDGAKITLKKTSGQDTVFNNSIFRWGQYTNGPFRNQIQMQLFLNGISTSNNISINPYFRSLDSNHYYTVGVPRYAFGGSGNIIEDSIVFTLAGSDLSGALGFFIDYLQLQTGINNTVQTPTVYSFVKNASRDSIILTMTDGTRYPVKDSTGSSGGGTVTSISQGYGITNTPNPIVSTGTIKVDTALLLTKLLAASLYQPILTAGTNITIVGNTISASAPGTGTVTTVTGTAPIVITSTPTTTPNVTITAMDATHNGYVAAGGSASKILHGDGTWKDTATLLPFTFTSPRQHDLLWLDTTTSPTTIKNFRIAFNAPLSWNYTTGAASLDTSTSITGATTLYQNSLKQNQLSGTGYVKFATTTPSYLTPTQVTADLNLFTTSLQGLVPASGGGTTNFLRADGSWAAASGSSGWSLTGNSLLSRVTNYLGTSDTSWVRFATKGVERGHFDSTGLYTSASSFTFGEDTYLGFDGLTNQGFGFVKKTSSRGGLAFGSTATFNVYQSSATNIFPSNTFTSRFIINANGTVGVLGTNTNISTTGNLNIAERNSITDPDIKFGLWTNGIANTRNTAVLSRMAFIVNDGTSGTGVTPLTLFGTNSVGIGSVTESSPTSIFSITSTTRGMLKPRMTTAQRDNTPGVATGTIVGGSGYTNATYGPASPFIPLTGGTGTGATATIGVVGGAVSSVTIAASGIGYKVGDVLSATAASIGGTGSGFTYTILTTAAATGLEVYNTTTNSHDTYNGLNFNGVVVSSAGTLTLLHGNDYSFTGTTSTWTLPAVSGSIVGRQNMITIKNRGSGAITLNSNAGSTIYTTSAVSTITINAGDYVTLMPDGTYFNKN